MLARLQRITLCSTFIALFACPLEAEPRIADIAEYTILDQIEAPKLFKQCSREAPVAISAIWMPTDDDIRRIELKLTEQYHILYGGYSSDRILRQWNRQYAGYVLNGQQYIYGSFFPSSYIIGIEDWKRHALIFCDGGLSLFGIEFDFKSLDVVKMRYNGH